MNWRCMRSVSVQCTHLTELLRTTHRNDDLCWRQGDEMRRAMLLCVWLFIHGN